MRNRAVTSPSLGLHDADFLGILSRSRFLSSNSDAEQSRIVALTLQASRAIEQWAVLRPQIRRERILPLSLTFAASAPFADVDSLVLAARQTLWIFLLDDLFDEEQLPDEALLHCVEDYCALVKGTAIASSDDVLCEILAGVREDLSRAPLFAALGREWEHALRGTIGGMVREHEWRIAYRRGDLSALPSYEEYLSIGRYSIGAPPHIWAALILIDDPSTPACLHHLRSMMQIASVCIRLANDLRSAAKEIEEGKTNALLILSLAFRQEGASPELAWQRAEARIRSEIDEGLASLAHLAANRRTRTGRPEALINDLAHFVYDFYAEHDYHTFASSQ